MRKLVLILFAALCVCAPASAKTVDFYDFVMSVKVPRVFNNSESTGYRKYETQKIKGQFALTYEDYGYPKMTFLWATNYTHKTASGYVGYKVTVDDDMMYHRMNFIGNNRTGVFKTPTWMFASVLEPSYALTEANEDNSLYLYFAGRGTHTFVKGAMLTNWVRGYVAGSIGCGCTDYGHKSPTRVAGECGPRLDTPDDVCAVFGIWKAKLRKSESCR